MAGHGGGHGGGHETSHSGDHGGDKGGGFFTDLTEAIIPDFEKMLFDHHGVADVASKSGADLEAPMGAINDIGAAFLGPAGEIKSSEGHGGGDHGGGHGGH